MSVETERSDLADLDTKQAPAPDDAAGGVGQPAKRSGLYIAFGMMMLLAVLVYLNMG